MKGGNLTFVMRNPLMAPHKSPTLTPSSTDSQPGKWLKNAVLPITMDVKTVIAPQERSIPAVKIISVCPIATAPTTATC